MPRALVFINTGSDTTSVIKDLEQVEGISEAHSSHGMYEAVAMVQAESFGKVKDIVSRQIRTIENVKSTLTLTLIEAAAT